jgi:hypothetical protein
VSGRDWRTLWRGNVLEPDGLSLLARAVAVVLCEYANAETGLAWPSADTIGGHLCTSERSARRGLDELAAAGWVTLVERGCGRGNPSVYRLDKPGAGAAFSAYRKAAQRRQKGGRNPAPVPGNQRTSRTREPGDRALARAPAANANAQQLVAYFVDACRAEGADPPKRLRGQVARHVGELVAEGYPAETIAEALRLMIAARQHPATLSSFILEAQAGPRRRHEHVADIVLRAALEDGQP